MFYFIRVAMAFLLGNKRVTKTPKFIPVKVGLMVHISKPDRASGFIETFMMFSAPSL